MTNKNNLPTNFIKHTSKNPVRRYFLYNFHTDLIALCRKIRPYSILDVGCGEGFTLNTLQILKIGKKLEGIDYSREAVKIGNIQFPKLNLKVGDIYKTQFKENAFDLVICTEVLEHLDKPQIALKELFRISKKYIIISVPNEPLYMLSRFFSGINMLKLGDHPEHINHWTASSFQKFIIKNKGKIKILKLPFPWTLVLVEK